MDFRFQQEKLRFKYTHVKTGRKWMDIAEMLSVHELEEMIFKRWGAFITLAL